MKLRPIGLRVASAPGLVLAFASFAGCDSSPPAPKLNAIVPAMAHNDRPTRVLLKGQDLWPAYRIDVATGQRIGDASGFSGWVGTGTGVMRAELRNFTWRDPGELSATLEPGLAPGMHPVVVIDPRGARAELSATAGFLCLGEDLEGPRIDIERPAPGTFMVAGGRLSGRLTASDDSEVARLEWQVEGPATTLASGSCTVDPGVIRVSCELEMTIPDGLKAGDTLQLQVTAADRARAPNARTTIRAFVLRAPPAVLDVIPRRGGTGGGTEVVVRGSGFFPGSKVYFGRALLQPEGGILLDDQTITGRTPPHPRGHAVVRAATPLGEAREDQLFEFLAPPTVQAIEPAMAASAGGTPLRVLGEHFDSGTRILVGSSLRAAIPLLSQSRTGEGEILGTAPPRPAGAAEGARLSVFAVDPEAGWGALPDALTFLPP